MTGTGKRHWSPPLSHRQWRCKFKPKHIGWRCRQQRSTSRTMANRRRGHYTNISADRRGYGHDNISIEPQKNQRLVGRQQLRQQHQQQRQQKQREVRILVDSNNLRRQWRKDTKINRDRDFVNNAHCGMAISSFSWLIGVYFAWREVWTSWWKWFHI